MEGARAKPVETEDDSADVEATDAMAGKGATDKEGRQRIMRTIRI